MGTPYINKVEAVVLYCLTLVSYLCLFKLVVHTVLSNCYL